MKDIEIHLCMYYKFVDKELHLIDKLGKRFALSLADIVDVHSFAVSDDEKTIAISALRVGGEKPSAFRGHEAKGDYRLYLVDLATNEWRLASKEYAVDPFWLPGQPSVIYYGSGKLCRYDLGAAEPIKLMKLGGFVLNPLGLSSNHSGTRVACVKYKGNSKHLTDYNFITGEATIHRQSCYLYGWLNDNELVYCLGDGFKALNLATKTSRTFFSSKAIAALVGVGAKDLIFGGISPDSLDVVGERIYFGASVLIKEDSRRFLASVSLSGDNPIVHAEFKVHCSYVHLGEGFFRIDHHEKHLSWETTSVEYFGKPPINFNEGYLPVKECYEPDFGVRMLSLQPPVEKSGE